MKISTSWLLEYLQPNEPISSSDLVSAFIHLGFEVESVSQIGQDISGPLVIGKVLHIEELSEFKKPIRYCQVQVGNTPDQVNGIVCGAANFGVGDLVVVALPGAILPGNFSISQRETYGRLSNGMICSLKELGISDDHSGILVLDESYLPGEDAISSLDLIDSVLDISILPDRGYAMSVRGLVRELAIYFECDFIDPISKVKKIESSSKPKVGASITATESCSSLVVTTMSGYSNSRPTPWPIKRKLMLSGMRSISLAVDITNYIMLEIGQPLHAFDRGKVNGNIVIRNAIDGEELETLDHVSRNLTVEDTVVADNSHALSIAGIMGGLNSEISSDTNAIVLEAANFNSENIAKTSRRYVLSSEASRRFERGVDPLLPEIATMMAIELFLKHGNVQIEGIAKTLTKPEVTGVDFDVSKFYEISGFELPLSDVENIFRKLGCIVEIGDSIKVLPPTWRPDLLTTNDLAEELLRIVGYDSIPLRLPSVNPGHGLSIKQRRKSAVKTYLASNGLVEVLNYPFLSRAEVDLFSIENESRVVKVANPLSEQQPYLRQSLLPGLLNATQRNIGRGINRIAVFETGSTFEWVSKNDLERFEFPLDINHLEKIDKAIPCQKDLLSIMVLGDIDPQSPLGISKQWDWINLFQLLSKLFTQFGVDFEINQLSLKGFHPGRGAQILNNGLVVGVAGELHPQVQESIGSTERIMALEIDLDSIFGKVINEISASEIWTYPIAKEDLSIIVKSDIPALKLLDAVRGVALPELESVELFDIYRGEQVPSGMQSATFSLIFRAKDRTLEATEVADLKSRVLKALEDAFGAKLRF